LEAETVDRHTEKEEPDPRGLFQAVQRFIEHEDVFREPSVDKTGRLLNEHHEVPVAIEECCLAIDVKDMEHEECGDSK
jgi:hypothetical protein